MVKGTRFVEKINKNPKGGKIMKKLKKEMLKILKTCELFLKNKYQDNEWLMQESLFINDMNRVDYCEKLKKKLKSTLDKIQKVKKCLREVQDGK